MERVRRKGGGAGRESSGYPPPSGTPVLPFLPSREDGGQREEGLGLALSSGSPVLPISHSGKAKLIQTSYLFRHRNTCKDSPSAENDSFKMD